MIGDLSRARTLVSAARRIVAFTGAGISAESGIPTYRGEGGLWKTHDAQKAVQLDYFRKDPTLFWNFFKDVRYHTLVSSRPNRAHLALAQLQRAGKLTAVITQNIDGLHKEAGCDPVIELHGNTRIVGCTGCGRDYGYQEARDKLNDQMPPLCDNCQGVLKPRVTFFGEALPDGAMENAVYEAGKCDLMLVVGSTLEVFPAASIPVLAVRSRAKLIIVNVGPTAMDSLADVVIDGKAGEVLPALIDPAGV